MIPNSDIWGAPSSWEESNISDVGYYNGCIEGKFCPFNTSEGTSSSRRYNITSAVSAGKLTPGSDLDASCCPWRMKGDSYFLSLQKLWFPDAYTANASPLFTDTVKQQGVPVMISTLPTNTSKPKITEIEGIWNPDPAAPGINPYYSTSPLLQFNYLKIFLHAKVCCSAYNDVEPSDCRVYGVDDYFDNQHELYPYLRGLMFDVYVWAGNRWTSINYDLFNIIPVNAYVAGFTAGSISILGEDFYPIRDGINGKGIGSQTDKNGGIIFDDSYIAASESQSYVNQMSSSQKSVSYVAMPEDWDLHVFSRWGIHYAAPYKRDVQKEWVLSQFATLGFWFYTGYSPLQCNTSDPDSHTYIPLFDDWGTTTGEYLSGADALTAPAAAWRNDVFERDVYHGEPPFDPSHYDDNNTVLPDVSTEYIPTTASLYAMPIGTVKDLIAYLNNVSADLTTDFESSTKFLTNDPIDIISGLLYFPFDITEYYAGELGSKVDIILGNVLTDVEAYKIDRAIVVYDAGSVIYYPPDGLKDFRSYKPYSSAELYIPYCGSINIDPTDYIGHNVSVKYLIDLQSGSCLALVYRDNMVLSSITGQIGVSVPLTGVQTATMQAAQQRADAAQKAATIQAVGGAVTAAATAAAVIAAVPTGGTSLAGLAALGLAGSTVVAGAQGLNNYQNLQYELEHQQTPYKTVSTASAVTSMGNEQKCRLIIKRPIMLDNYEPSIYGHDTGFACCITAPLSTFSGYTQVSNVELSDIDCTSSEKSLIIQALQTGVYL